VDVARRLPRVFVLLALAFVFTTGAAGGVVPGKQPPANTTPPTISGTAQTGQTLTATPGSWTGAGIGYAFQWLRCDTAGASCAALAGQTSTAHLIPPAEAGSTLRVRVTARNKTGFAAATSAATAVVTAPAAPPPSPAPTAQQNGRFGFAAGGDLQNLSSSDLTRYLDGAQAAHSGWVRFDLNWEVIQAGGPTSSNWAPLDNVVRATTARGLKVLAMIAYTPSWARAPGTTGKTPPTNLSDYTAFAGAAVARYAPLGVHAFERRTSSRTSASCTSTGHRSFRTPPTRRRPQPAKR
jgi:hypothetical protein